MNDNLIVTWLLLLFIRHSDSLLQLLTSTSNFSRATNHYWIIFHSWILNWGMKTALKAGAAGRNTIPPLLADDSNFFEDANSALGLVKMVEQTRSLRSRPKYFYNFNEKSWALLGPRQIPQVLLTIERDKGFSDLGKILLNSAVSSIRIPSVPSPFLSPPPPRLDRAIEP